MNHKLPIGKWVAAGVDWLEHNNNGLVDKISKIIDAFTGLIESG